MTDVLFRFDASAEIGAGHMTRCVALAEALHATGRRVTFAARRDTRQMIGTATAAVFSLWELDPKVEDEPTVLRNRYPNGVDLLVVDHYGRDVSFERACRSWARQIFVLDDTTGRSHDCDILVDAAASDDAVYKGCVPDCARVLCGAPHALIRRSFINRRAEALRRRDGRRGKKVLISFGATDPKNVTSAALDALANLDEDVEITIALSSRAPHVDEIRRRARGRMRLVLDAEMSELMTDADLAIGATGTTSYERAVLGLPSIVVTLSNDQRGVARSLIAAGAAIDAGDFDEDFKSRLLSLTKKLLDDPAALKLLASTASALVDGRGSQRVLAELAGTVPLRNGLVVRLRLAEKDDGDWLFRLQQEPQTRRYARNPSVPMAQEHRDWFSKVLQNADVFLLVIEVDGKGAGSVRLDPTHHAMADSFEISIAVDPKLHGRGVGTAALSLARRLQAGTILEAEILSENLASQRLFSAAGFHKVAATRYRQLPSFGERCGITGRD
jgi:UDP-2,4-diacetamido-2,4,6-trideoxy-beta-L-altropyranose hydrolase